MAQQSCVYLYTVAVKMPCDESLQYKSLYPSSPLAIPLPRLPCIFLRWKRGDPRKLFLMELRRVLQGSPPREGLGGGVGLGVPAGLSLGVCTGVPLGVGSGLARGEP